MHPLPYYLGLLSITLLILAAIRFVFAFAVFMFGHTRAKNLLEQWQLEAGLTHNLTSIFKWAGYGLLGTIATAVLHLLTKVG